MTLKFQLILLIIRCFQSILIVHSASGNEFTLKFVHFDNFIQPCPNLKYFANNNSKLFCDFQTNYYLNQWEKDNKIPKTCLNQRITIQWRNCENSNGFWFSEFPFVSYKLKTISIKQPKRFQRDATPDPYIFDKIFSSTTNKPFNETTTENKIIDQEKSIEKIDALDKRKDNSSGNYLIFIFFWAISIILFFLACILYCSGGDCFSTSQNQSPQIGEGMPMNELNQHHANENEAFIQPEMIANGHPPNQEMLGNGHLPNIQMIDDENDELDNQENPLDVNDVPHIPVDDENQIVDIVENPMNPDNASNDYSIQSDTVKNEHSSLIDNETSSNIVDNDSNPNLINKNESEISEKPNKVVHSPVWV